MKPTASADGVEALRCGWASEVVKAADLEARTEELARQKSDYAAHEIEREHVSGAFP